MRIRIAASCQMPFYFRRMSRLDEATTLASDRQWAAGVCPGFSTKSLLIHLIETWRSLVDEGNVVAVAFISFEKAFHSVNHEILISKLQQNFGICDPFLTWLKSYFNDRQSLTEPNRNFFQLTTVFHKAPFYDQHYSRSLLTIFH